MCVCGFDLCVWGSDSTLSSRILLVSNKQQTTSQPTHTDKHTQARITYLFVQFEGWPQYVDKMCIHHGGGWKRME